MKANNILVTGGFGNIGLPLVDMLINEKHYVFVIDDLSNKDSLARFERMNFRAKVTYTNLEYFEHMWNDVEFSTIIHLAGYNDASNVDTNFIRAFEDNILNTLRVINRCIQQNSTLIYLYWPNTSTGLLKFLHEETCRLIQFYQETKNLQVKIINTESFDSNESICKKIISEL